MGMESRRELTLGAWLLRRCALCSPAGLQRPRAGSCSGGCTRFTCDATTTRCSSTTRSALWTPWPRCGISTSRSVPPRLRSCMLSAGCWHCSMVRPQEEEGVSTGLEGRGQPGPGATRLRSCQQESWGPIFLTKSQGCGYDKRYMPSFVKVCVDVNTNLHY